MAKKIQTNWNLKQFYSSHKDPQIEKDIQVFEKVYRSFAKKYAGKDSYTTNVTSLKRALEDYEQTLKKSAKVNKAFLYFMYRNEVDSSDSLAEAMVAKLSERITKTSNLVLFFDLALGTITSKKQKEFLQDKKLEKYHYFLERVFAEAKYQLSEKEEKVLALKSQPARGMWVQGREKSETKKVVSFKGKDLPIAEAMNKVSTLSTKERRTLYKDTMETLKTLGDFAESEINAVFTDKKINDELRGFKKPYSATILGYENDEKSIENLVETVTKDFKYSSEFFTLKKKLLGLNELTYADRAVSIGKVQKKYTFDDSYKILHDIFYSLGKEYGEILDRFMENGQIDAFPRKGKGGGAYCSSDTETPTMVFLNHVNSFNSLMTFAHEMGHAIHSELSKSQPILYEGYTTSVAETASTFFEAVVFDAIFKTLNDKEKIVALHDRIQDDVSTIHRQIAFFNFELELHNGIRTKGTVSQEEIAEMLNKHMKAYMGPSMKLTPLDGYFFVTVSHFRRPFYVYSYSYGQLISKALYKKYENDPAYISKVKEFLSAGGSKSPERIFGDIGIHTKSPEVFKAGLTSFREDIALLKKLTKK